MKSSLYYDPFDAAILADPYPIFADLRRDAPLYHVEKRNYYVLTRHADVLAAIRDHATYSSSKGNSPEPGFAPGLIGTDPPRHTRLRRILQSVFTPRAIERNWGARLQTICDQLVDAALHEGEVDAFRSLSLPLPVQVIAEMLGIPDGDLAQFKHWSDDMCDGVSLHLDPTQRQRTEKAFFDLFAYFTGKVAERKTQPGADLISMVCEAGEDERLNEKEVVYFCILLLIAGNETTTNLIGNGLLSLLDHPDEQRRLRELPSLWPGAIEEMLRYRPPTQAVFRQTTRAVDMHGETIPENARVMLSIASANRDERVFVEPEKFVADRQAEDHLGFGGGIHFCMGAALARLEARTLFQTLFARCRSMRKAGEAELISTPVIRGPIKLPIRFEAI